MADVTVAAGVAQASASAQSPDSTVAPAPASALAAGSAATLGSVGIKSAPTLASAHTVMGAPAALVGQNDTDEATASETVEATATGVFYSDDPPHTLLWHPDPEQWAVEQSQARHNGVLWRLGEYAMFILLWRVSDLKAGRVRRCPECVGAMGDIGEVYNQSFKTRCPTCYGTTFEGGYKAKIVRPSLWDFSETTNRVDVQGEVERANTAVQTTHDFAMRTGDYILRADGTRWRVQSLSTNHMRTGFGFPDRDETIVGFNYGNVILQDESSNAYAIELPDELAHILDITAPREMADFSRFEEIRGPLLDGSPNASVSTSGYLDQPTPPSTGTYAQDNGIRFPSGWNL